MTRQLVARLVAQNYAPGSVEAGLCPSFRLGKIDDGKLQTAANLISQLVTGGSGAAGGAVDQGVSKHSGGGGTDRVTFGFVPMKQQRRDVYIDSPHPPKKSKKFNFRLT